MNMELFLTIVCYNPKFVMNKSVKSGADLYIILINMFGRTSIMIAEVGMVCPNIEVMYMVKSLKI